MPTPDPDPPAPTPARRPRKKTRAGLVGPLFKWELVRLARRGQDARARFILAASLLAALTLFTVYWFPHVPVADLFTGTSQVTTIQESASFANNFALTFVLTQLAVLCLLTPAYAAGGIAEEKEKKTFPFLLVTALTPREIVFGKFLGRLVFLLGVMLAGLPVLALTLLYGGVSVRFLLVSYFITGSTITLLAAIGVASAAYSETFRGALFRSYGLAALHVCAGCGMTPFLSPFSVVVFVYNTTSAEWANSIGFGYGGGELLVSLFAVGLAVKAVRNARAAPVRRPPPRTRPRRETDDDPPEKVMPLDGAERVVARPVEPARPRRRRPRLPPEVLNRPRLGDRDPFWWKERYVAPAKRDADDDSIRGVVIAVGVVLALTLGFFALVALVSVLASGGSTASLKVAQRLLVIGGSAGVFCHLLMIGSAAAGAVCRERQRLTLESLLTIPVDRGRILWPKWLMSLGRGWWWGGPAAGCVVLGLLAATPPTLALPGAVYLLAVGPFAAGFGLWLSVRCRTVTRAVLWFLPAAGGAVLVPIAAWWATDPQSEWSGLGMLASAAAAVGIGAVGFWRASLSEFENEGRN